MRMVKHNKRVVHKTARFTLCTSFSMF